jgi:hypothetical protein
MTVSHTPNSSAERKLTVRLKIAATLYKALVATDCARASAMCQWTAVDEWLAQQRAEAEARERMWQLFGPQPSPVRIEQVRQWLDERR